MPSPTAEPKATPRMMMPNARMVAAATKASELTMDLSRSVLFGRLQREIDDAEEGEDERLHGTYEEIEKLNEERHDRCSQREIKKPDRDALRDDLCDDDKEQFADEDVEEQPCRQSDGPDQFVE